MDNNPKSTYRFYPTLEELEDKIQKFKKNLVNMSISLPMI